MSRPASHREGDTNDVTSPLRTCVSCRRHRQPDGLLRLQLMQGSLVMAAKRGGRGAHVCVKRECIKGLTAGSLSRALRVPVADLDTDALLCDANRLAQRRLLDTIGLARRQGALTPGVERIVKRNDSFVVVASDLSERGRRTLSGVPSFIEGHELGRAAGMGWLGAVSIAEPLAKQAAYWLTLWYESRSAQDASRCGVAPTPEHSKCSDGE